MNEILDWFENTCIDYPERIAFIDPERQITWGDLRVKAMSCGAYFAGCVDANSAIVFYMEKNVDAVCAMLGTVYADCFYSFIDIKQPANRVEKIADTLKPEIVITDKKNIIKALEVFGRRDYIKVIEIADLINEYIEDNHDEGVNELANRRINHIDTSPLYVNFTSGSTGTPKGVVVGHRSVMDFIGKFVDLFEITNLDVLANQAPFDFDVSVKDIYSAIKTGATVVMIPREYFMNPTTLMDYICDHHTTVLIWAVSAMCFISGMSCFKYRIPGDIRMVLFSGEVMPVKQLMIWKKYLPDTKYVNVYGPTEITCNCTYYVVPSDISLEDKIPIGKPFPNEKVFLLDEYDRLVLPFDKEKKGEICVSGSCLAIGYYGDINRTKEKFVQNPLNKNFTEIIYRTGDLAYYTDDEKLCYAGRIDNQIKINGHRIEISEIEWNVEKIDEVDRACCIYDEERARLIMYYVGAADALLIRSQLKKELPDYMIPGKITKIDRFPLNKNGKVDRKKLGEMIDAQ